MRFNLRSAKRLVSFLLAILSLAMVVLPVAAQLQTRATVAESTYTCLVRNRASASSPVIGQMEDGTVVTVLEQVGNYYKVDCYDMTGYIAADQLQLEEDTYRIRCVPGAKDTAQLPLTTLAEALDTRSSMLELAKQQLGIRYVYGDITPGGFDCSGLMYYIYGKHGISLHRCADEQMQDGLIVSKDALQVGDLLFFREAGTPWLASHVGIYAGNGQMIHAGRGGMEYADLSASYYANYFICARRVVNIGVASVDSLPAAAIPSAAGVVNNGLRTPQ